MKQLEENHSTEAQPDVLALSRANAFAPGSNLTGGLAAASWRFLLPKLRFAHVAVWGEPDAAELEVYLHLAPRLTVLTPEVAAVRARMAQGTAAARRVAVAKLEPTGSMALETGSVDLLILASGRSRDSHFHWKNHATEMVRILAPDGVYYAEACGFSERRALGIFLRALGAHGLARPRRLWMTPFRGEVRTAFPLGDRRLAAYLFSSVLFGQSVKKRVLSGCGKVLSRTGVLFPLVSRIGVIGRGPTPGLEAPQPPRYLADLAAQHGLDLHGYRCGLSARGKYRANKNIFYLTPPDGREPEFVLKMTRAPEYNGRLENEFQALQNLRQGAFVAPETYPEAVFFGMHAGLAVAAQKAVRGKPFRRRTAATLACPLLSEALDWIYALGSRSQHHSAEMTSVTSALADLLARFRDIYGLAPAEEDFLRRQLDSLAQCTDPFPLVFMHGDLGTWNVYVCKSGRIIVLDWEAGEADGLPLWDFFYFMRAYGNWMHRVKGSRDTLRSFEMNFLQPSAFGRLFFKKVRDYCAGVAMPLAGAAPLFYFCWLHRALKEATRLQPQGLQAGHYVNLLRMCIRRGDFLHDQFAGAARQQPASAVRESAPASRQRRRPLKSALRNR